MADYNIPEVGTGALFPIILTDNGLGKGWYPVEGDPTLIENNLRSLIEYNIGQRFRQEDFGTRLLECIEEPNTQALNYIVRKFLVDAIRKYETRLKIKKITTTRYNQYLYIVMEYKIVGFNLESSMTLKYDSTINSLTT